MENTKYTILIVDDEETNIELLAEALTSKYLIRVAYDGSQALKLLEKFDDIDLVLLDIQMPVMDGFEVASYIMGDKKLKETPFIFLTSHVDKDFIKKGFDLGAKDYMKKPFNMDELFIRIHTHLKTSYLQKELEKQKEEFETIFHYAGDGIAKIDLEGNFLSCNKAFRSLTGFSKEEILTKNCYDLVAPEYKEKNRLGLNEAIQKGHMENFEKECIVENNKRITVNMSITLLPDKKSLLIIAKDTTSLKLIEEQLRLASLGEMIGNIAHQWRQPLSIITTSISGLEFKFDYHGEITKEEFHEVSHNILTQSSYLSKTIDHFRDFIKGDQEHKTITILEVLENTLALVDGTLSNNNITLVVDKLDNFNIVGNVNELSEAFINIINNAKDVLSQKVQNNEDRFLFITTKLLDTKSIRITFKDSGGGIDESIVKRIFEPYFTTKHQSIGTGLGLSVSDKIIRQRYHGVLKAYNEEYKYNGKSYKGACIEVIFSAK